jgi:hypothetical protein
MAYPCGKNYGPRMAQSHYLINIINSYRLFGWIEVLETAKLAGISRGFLDSLSR